MASDPPIAGFDLRPEPFPLNGNHTQLVSQLSEEVGFLSGVLMVLDLNSDDRASTLENAMDHWQKLAAARRSSSVTKEAH